MSTTPQRQELAAFWQGLAEALNAGKSPGEALEELGRAMPDGSAMSPAVARLVALVLQGKSLAEAVGQQEAFSPAMEATVSAGEAHGTLRAAAAQIAASLAEGPGAPRIDAAPQAIRYVSELFQQAAKNSVTDIHFDPTADGKGLVRTRIDGVLHVVESPPPGAFAAVVDYLKVMGAMNVTDRRLPQDGMCLTPKLDFRLAVMPVFYGERVTVRLLTRDLEQIKLGLTNLGLSPDDLQKVRALARLPRGIIIANGPTGEGKTTLLYSILMDIGQPEKVILTIEDPVEIALPGVAQTQLRPQIGLTFVRAIRHMLRQAPNILMVGELRDLETAEVCVQAAMTGHLLFTTLHADTSPGAIKRLLEMGLKPFMLAASLSGVISPRLVRMLCPQCQQLAEPPMDRLPTRVRDKIKELRSSRPTRFSRPVGCEICQNRGYRGRTALFEILKVDDRLRHLIAEAADLPTLRATAVERGMKSLLDDGLEKAAAGITSIDEILRCVPPEESEG